MPEMLGYAAGEWEITKSAKGSLGKSLRDRKEIWYGTGHNILPVMSLGVLLKNEDR
jgi:hypothetical protein